MTVEERNEHREALRRLGEERERFIAEHREKMRARAEERGVELEEDEQWPVRRLVRQLLRLALPILDRCCPDRHAFAIRPGPQEDHG